MSPLFCFIKILFSFQMKFDYFAGHFFMEYFCFNEFILLIINHLDQFIFSAIQAVPKLA